MNSMSLKVLRKTRSREFSSAGSSQSCLKVLKRFSMGNRPKFIEPMLSEATSGLKVSRRLDALLHGHVGRAAGGEVDHGVGAPA